ncbi:MAG: flavin reductase family protein, partial [Rhodobacteraceae bacterium]|nr:flavin reductase family protein [Paracoccaceae bacterium]
DGIFDVTRFQPLARLGYRDYTVVDNVFSLNRPGQS